VVDKEKQKNKNWWLAIAGIALGIGVQLHTLSLLITPIVVMIFLWFKLDTNKAKFKYIGIIFAVAIFLNIPQIVSEIQTGGRNTKDFILGVEEKLKIHTDLTTDLYTDIACHVQANSMVISSFGNTANCSFGNLIANENGVVSLAIVWLRIILSFVFSILGYSVLYYFWKKEAGMEKKDFLQLISLFVVASFVVFFPLADDATDRYYLVFAFVPIILLGLLYNYLRKKSSHAVGIGILILTLLVIQNVITLKKYFTPFQRVGLMEDSMLSENEGLANFILTNMHGQTSAYIEQKQGDWRIMNYFLADKIFLIHMTKNITSVDNTMPYFLITDIAHAKTIGQASEYLAGYKSMKQASFGVFTIIVFSK
jgi:4-amino-4-deoxy-L-arabinose transferase-like glycosyltransferase